MAATFLSDLIDPEVIADFVETKLVDAIKFAPLCVVDNTLVGRAGDTLSFPVWTYIGDAAVVAEGGTIAITNLANSMTPVQVHKLAKGVGFTDEAKLSGLGGAQLAQEAVSQIVTSIASKAESEILTEMAKASLTYAYDAQKKGATNIAAALELFGEDMDGEKVLLIAPDKYSTIIDEIIPNTDAGANILKSGNVGTIMGCQVVVSNRLKNTNSAYIVKPGAMRLVSKRGVMVEFDRDPQTQTDYIYGSKLYAPYLYDASKIIKITV
jgi:hypothetical protein